VPVDTLGEDLVLLAIQPGNGTLAARQRLPYGLRGSELVRLAASGRAAITRGRIVVLDHRPTGDDRLDAALASLAQACRPPQAATDAATQAATHAAVSAAVHAAHHAASDAGGHGGHGGGGGGHH
jgi:hypothetical protein